MNSIISYPNTANIFSGASQGKGRGRQVIAVARTADLILMVLDATKKDIHKSLLEAELEAVGIRLNCKKPSIYFKQKATGGIKFTATCKLTKCDEKMVQRILQEYKIFNAEVLFREYASPDQFIDVIMGNCIYIPCLYVWNKIDQIPLVSAAELFYLVCFALQFLPILIYTSADKIELN